MNQKSNLDQNANLPKSLTKAELDLLLQFKSNMKTEKTVKPKMGDILGLNRELAGVPYEHYGVYAGNGRVVHYTSLDPGVTFDLQILETSFKHFLKSNEDYFILSFDHLKQPVKSDLIPVQNLSGVICPKCAEFLKNLMEFREMLKRNKMKLYSPKETVKRAKSRLGEKEYNLLLNNCEHFAIWCKTGLSKSYQIEKLIKILIPRKGCPCFEKE